MSRRLKIGLLVIGAFLLLAGALALAFAYWPLADLQLQETLSPTLFVAPP